MIATLITTGVIAIIGIAGIRIVRPTEKMLVETLGKFTSLKEAGFHWIIPVIQSTGKINVTEQMVDVEPQTVITKDNLNTEVDAIIYYKIIDAKKAAYNVDDFEAQLVQLAQTTLRSVFGRLTLTDANEAREKINYEVEKILEKETQTYGVDVLRVEIKEITPPEDVQHAMNEVIKAEKAKIAAKETANALEIESDGKRRAMLKEAEGHKQSAILKAEGEAKAFDLINKSFTGNAQKLKALEVTEKSLKDNSKIIITQKGISPQILVGDLPVVPVKK